MIVGKHKGYHLYERLTTGKWNVLKCIFYVFSFTENVYVPLMLGNRGVVGRRKLLVLIFHSNFWIGEICWRILACQQQCTLKLWVLQIYPPSWFLNRGRLVFGSFFEWRNNLLWQCSNCTKAGAYVCCSEAWALTFFVWPLRWKNKQQVTIWHEVCQHLCTIIDFQQYGIDWVHMVTCLVRKRQRPSPFRVWRYCEPLSVLSCCSKDLVDCAHGSICMEGGRPSVLSSAKNGKYYELECLI